MHPVVPQGELCNCGVVDGGEFGRLLQVFGVPQFNSFPSSVAFD